VKAEYNWAVVRVPRRQQSFLRYPLSWILASEGSVRVLRELALHGGELSIPMLAASTGLNEQTVRNLVTRDLAATGIVESIGHWRSVLYRLARGHALSATLDQLFGAEEQRVRRVFDTVAAVAQDMGPAIIAVWLYGSAARGDDGPGSDIDLAVVVKETDAEKTIELYRKRLMATLESESVAVAVIGVSPSDVRRLIKEDAPMWSNLVADARPLFGPTPDALGRRLMRRGGG
jgi:predicted nucleotidyltransferase